MLRSAERVNLCGIPDRIDDIMFVVLDLLEDAFRKDLGTISLSKFIADDDQPLSRRFVAARPDLVTNSIGQRVVVKALSLQVSGDFAFTRGVPASKSYQHVEALRYYDSFSLGRDWHV